MSDDQRREQEREALLERIVEYMELPMVILGFLWLLLLILEFVVGLSPLLENLSAVIWGIFVLEFLLELIVAPRKLAYLKHNWLIIIALLVPALRIFRVLQVIRVAQGARLVRVVSSLNRGKEALADSIGRHGFRYVLALTLVVTFAGAAGMYAFERNPPEGTGLRSYPDALWWAAMIMTTIGSSYWPQTLEGRVLCIILSLYALSVFGFVTATLATFFVGREAVRKEGKVPSAATIAELRDEIARLTDQVRVLARNTPDDQS